MERRRCLGIRGAAVGRCQTLHGSHGVCAYDRGSGCDAEVVGVCGLSSLLREDGIVGADRAGAH